MKPFDLAAAQRGCPIQTRDGKPAKFLMHVPEAAAEYRVVALADGKVNGYVEDGRFYGEFESWNDLLMAPLCQVEGRDVYPGDVLYHESGAVTVFGMLGCCLEVMYAGGECGLRSPENLTWTKPKTKRVGWINVYPNRGDVMHSTEEEANQCAHEGRLACVWVEYEV